MELTPNEEQILQAIRALKPLDQLVIIKKSANSQQEFELKFQQVSFFFKTNQGT